MVSDNLAQLQHLKFGEIDRIPAPYGQYACRSSASSSTTRTSRGRSSSTERCSTCTGTTTPSTRFACTDARRRVPDVQDRILDRYAGRRHVFALTNAELKE